MIPDRRLADAIYREHFGAFVYGAFRALNSYHITPNWHIEAICYAVQQMITGQADNRLVLNLPPRSLKSFIISVCLPAWLLGRAPDKKIICVCYAHDLSYKFSRDCRSLMDTSFYKRIFPRTRLSANKMSEGEFETTAGGFRLATSIGGTLTGRGGDILIIDDPLKAENAQTPSRLALDRVNSWVLNTALSRLDSQKDGVVIVTMQRLHEFDLSGMLMERGWRCLTMPQIAMEPASYALGPNEVHERPEGEPLQPKRDDPEALKSHRLLIGSRLWSAQYQQQPLPTEGNIIKTSWMPRYEFSPGERRFRRTVLSCDPAGKPGDHNDYTAITVFGFDTKPVHLLNANRGHWSVLQMLRQITTLAREWNVGVVLVEDTASGMGLIQLLREQSNLQVIGCRPDVNKEMRMSRHEGRFESGQVVLPKEAPWLAELETELFGFPHARHDDYVDSILQFLDWYSNRRFNRPPEYLGLPIVG